MTFLDTLGWSAFANEWNAAPDMIPARVVSQQRGQLGILSEQGPAHALMRGSLMHDPPVVGDWVVVKPVGDQWLIVDRMPRHTVIQRRRVGGGLPQVVAANVDCVAVVTSMDGDFNPRRIERYLAVVRGAGCEARVLLSKADRAEDVAAFTEALSDPYFVVSALHGQGVDALGDWVGDRTLALLGSSGVGKSTVINALLGTDVQDTGLVSDYDGRGQHTTTSRDLLCIPGGGCVIDTPGMREIGLTAEADPDEAFADIGALAARCSFRDCRHDNEPGCAVLEAIEGGELDAGRLRNHRKLGREMAFEARRQSKRAHSEARKEWGRRIKDVKRMKRERGW